MAKEEFKTVDEYIANVSDAQRPYVEKLRQAILKTIDSGFEECVGYGMIGYVVPLSNYPAGYHCNPKLPLPFANLAAQKNFIALYHMGMYGDPEKFNWFKESYARQCKTKLDMGKSCIRFKNYEDIPYELISELFSKMTAKDWIGMYEKMLVKK